LYGYQPTVEPDTTLLDYYTGSAAAYSLRNLSTSTTNVVKVRRSGDDAELDFSASQVSDGTLAAWVVAGGGTEDGFVTTWYDQSGNSNNGTQATAASQPKIVSSGTLVTENGKAALDFDGTDDYLSVNTGFSQPVFVSLVVKNIKSSASFPYYFDSNTSGRFLLYVEDASGITATAAYSGALRLNSNVIKTVQSLISCLYNTTSSFIAIDGQEVVSGAIDTNNINSPLYIGCRNTIAQFMQGTFQELIIYPSDETANRTGIEANINAHYNIYP